MYFWIDSVAIQIQWPVLVPVLDEILDSRHALSRARWEKPVIHIVLDLNLVRSNKSHNLA